MKFPLYNECPNCGHKAKKHDCNGCWANGFDHEKSSNVFILHCPCPLLGPEVNNSISIQAAIEVALQRAGVEDFRGPDSDFNIPGPVKRDAL